jgi:hypothetical protein
MREIEIFALTKALTDASGKVASFPMQIFCVLKVRCLLSLILFACLLFCVIELFAICLQRDLSKIGKQKLLCFITTFILILAAKSVD